MRELFVRQGAKASGVVLMTVFLIAALVVFLNPIRVASHGSASEGGTGESGIVPLGATNFAFLGYAVDDIEATRAEFTDNLGIEFSDVFSVDLPIRLVNGSVIPVTFKLSTSFSGPAYMELIETNATGNHPWKSNSQMTSTHIGYVVNDLQAASNTLEAAGWPRVATADLPGTSAFIFAYHEAPGGILIEVIDKNFLPVPGMCDAPSPFCPSN